MEKQLIDIAYELAKTKYAKKAFTFKLLWKELIKKAKLDAKEQEEVGHVYTAMLQDHRFIFVGNDQWKIREFLTLEEQMSYSNALYDFAKEEQGKKKTSDDDDSVVVSGDDEDNKHKASLDEIEGVEVDEDEEEEEAPETPESDEEEPKEKDE